MVGLNGEPLREGKEKFYSEGMESEAGQGAVVGREGERFLTWKHSSSQRPWAPRAGLFV